MSVAIPFHKQTVGRTFIIALTVLGIGALMQFGALSWLFLTRYRETAAPDNGLASTGPVASAVPTREFTDPFGADASPSTPSVSPSVTPPPRPAPLPIGIDRRASEPAPSDRLTELIEQGRALRERGDTYASVTKLREAEAMAEGNALPTAELAMTYEKMGFTEKAAECWKRIYEMGEAAGVYFAAAQGRYSASQAEAIKQATPDATAAGTPEISGANAAAPVSAAAKGEIVGINANCKLGLGGITRQDENDPTAKRKFVLKVPVKAKPRARIDVHDVIVQVVFYDIVNGRSLDKTNAQVSYKWSAPPADWADDDVEVLEVSYMLPDLRVSDEDRKYYGYLVSVYYKNALQDFRSDPAALAQKAKPPEALAADTP